MFFQSSVIKKNLAALNTEQLTAAWNHYKAYFLNKEIQDNIRSSKEEPKKVSSANSSSRSLATRLIPRRAPTAHPAAMLP